MPNKKGRTIQGYMTSQPYFVLDSDTLSTANHTMKRLDIRHLPVMRGREIYGIISDRDIKMAFGLSGIDRDAILVGDVCHTNPFHVSPDAVLSDVAEVMANKQYGCAIVRQGSKLVGIFTVVDACRALSELLRESQDKAAAQT